MIKLDIEVKYTNGESVTYTTGLPEWSKWERKTGKSVFSITQEKIASEGIGAIFQQADFLLLAYYGYVRAAAGKPTKTYEIWEVSVEEIEVGGSESPKATPSEVSPE